MAVSRNETIFLGHTPSEQRKFLVVLFQHLRKSHPKLYIPAVGEFTMPKCAIEAGYAPSDIFTSDVSLFSDLMGAIMSGSSVDDIPFTLAANHEEWERFVVKLRTISKLKDIRNIAGMMIAMMDYVDKGLAAEAAELAATAATPK